MYITIELCLLTDDAEGAPAAAASGEGRKSVQTLRSTDLDVFVCIATDKTPLLCHNPVVESLQLAPAQLCIHTNQSGSTPRRNIFGVYWPRARKTSLSSTALSG